MVECTALEMRRTCKGTVGSNPTLSANKKSPNVGGFFIGGTAEDRTHPSLSAWKQSFAGRRRRAGRYADTELPSGEVLFAFQRLGDARIGGNFRDALTVIGIARLCCNGIAWIAGGPLLQGSVLAAGNLGAAIFPSGFRDMASVAYGLLLAFKITGAISGTQFGVCGKHVIGGQSTGRRHQDQGQ